MVRPLQSVFLNPPILAADKLLSRVLVMGSGQMSTDLALRLTNEGFEVVTLLSNGDEDVKGTSAHAHEPVLEELHGFVGRFTARISSSTGMSTEPVGFVVASGDGVSIPKFSDYGLSPSDRITSLSSLESTLNNGTGLVKPRRDVFHVVFLSGLEGASDPFTFARIFDSIAQLKNRLVVQPYVFTRDVKVAAPGLERRYREVREEGTLFFKFDEDNPFFESGPDGMAIVFKDPVLGLELELVPDLIVVDEDQAPPISLKPLLQAIPSSAAMAPFLQPQSLRFSGVATPKAGILAVGPSRGNFDPRSANGDLEAVVVALKSAHLQDADPGLPGPPVVDPGKCTICLTCIRLCPHGAMSFQKRAEADPASCKRCGICAAECPMGAITLDPPAEQSSLAERLMPASGTLEGDDPQISVFMCRRSAAQAFESLDPAIRKGLTPIVVPCAGTIAPEHILSAFRNGSDGVMVAGCHRGNCASIYGTTLASERVSGVQALLEQAGIVPQKLMFTAMAGNTAGDFAEAIRVLKGLALSAPI